MADQLQTVQAHLSDGEGGSEGGREEAGRQAAQAFFLSLFLYSSIRSRACKLLVAQQELLKDVSTERPRWVCWLSGCEVGMGLDWVLSGVR